MKLDRTRLTIFGVFVAISLITRAAFLNIDILDIDESAHIVGSWELLSGKLLYTEFVDNKPPLLYVYYAFPQILFGRGMLPIRLLTILLTVPLTAFAASAFFNHTKRGFVAGLLYLIYSAAFLAHDMHAVHTEVIMILSGSWALVLVRDEEKALKLLRVMSAGFLLGLGFLVKYHIAFWLPAIALALVVACAKRRAWKRLLALSFAYAAGFAIPVILTYALFALRNGQQALLYWTVYNNLRYSANPILLSEAVGRAAAYLLPFLITTALLWYSWIRSLRLYGSVYNTILISLLLIFSFPAALLGYRFYPHYFIQFYIPLALAAAPFISQALNRPLNRFGKIVIGYSSVLLIGFTIANLILYNGKKIVYRERDPIFREVASRLRADSCYSHASLFVWGYAPIFYYYSELTPASRFAVMAQSGLTGYIPGNLESIRGKISTDQYLVQEHWNWLMDDLRKNHATYILDTAPAGIYRWNRYPIQNYPRLWNFIRANYEPAGSVGGVQIYREKRCNRMR
jgi:4-amino-4-deoxy-L-arabinose transferase-like glycosyltransferase